MFKPCYSIDDADQSRGRNRIAVFIEGLGYGGIARVYSEIIPFLCKSFEIDLIVFDGSVYSIDCVQEHVKKWEIWPNGGFRWFYPEKVFISIYRYSKILKRRKYEIVLSSGYFANFLSTLFAKKHSYKTIISQHADHRKEVSYKRNIITTKLFSYLLKNYFKKADAVVAVSSGVRSMIVNDFGVSSDKCHVIHNPINTKKIRKEIEAPNGQDEKQWFSVNDFHFISAGRFTAAKNFPLLLRAFSKVVKIVKNCKLTILGDGEERRALEKFAMELGIAEKVWLPGFKSNPFKFFAMANCFVSSSDWEGFGNVVVEAMLCGLPIISTRTSGAIDILTGEEDAVYGILVSIGDLSQLENEMLSIIRGFEQRTKFQNLAVSRSAVFDVKSIASKYCRLIEATLATKR